MAPRSASDGTAALIEAIRSRGRVEGPLVKVDDFLNHRVDPTLLDEVGTALADLWRGSHPDVVLTAEASGIAPALTTANALGVEMIYAKKYPRTVTERPSFVREVTSPTKNVAYRIEVATRILKSGDRVLIVDDFLSGGRTALALGEIVEEAGGIVVGFGFVIEKRFMEGRTRLEGRGWEVAALAVVTGIADGLTIEPGEARPETGAR